MIKSAAIYARYSSDNQREESIIAQVRICNEYASKNGYTVVKTYIDEAKSATTDNRPNFLKMIEDIKGGSLKVDLILVHKLDRFARNRYDSAIYKRELIRSGVRVESVLEHLDDSPESILLESMLEGLNEYYSKNLSREVMKGMLETAYQAKHNGGLPPLGYDVDNHGNYLINARDSKAVRIIFEMYGKSHSYKEILEVLNSRNFKTRSGRPFGKNSIHDILRNRKYTGCFIFNRSASKNIDGKRNNHKSKEPGKIIEIPNSIPQIIPVNLFNAVQERMCANSRNNSNGRYKSKVVYVLSGIIWCGECGQRMTGTSSSYKTRVSRETRQRYHYECNFAKRTHQCSTKKVSKELIECYVIQEINQQLLSESILPELAAKVYKHYLSKRKENSHEEPFLKEQIKACVKKIDNLVNALSEGGNSIRPLVEKLGNLETEKEELEKRLFELSSENKANEITEAQVLSYLRSHRDKFLVNNIEVYKQLAEEFVERVTVKKDTFEIILKVSVVSNASATRH